MSHGNCTLEIRISVPIDITSFLYLLTNIQQDRSRLSTPDGLKSAIRNSGPHTLLLLGIRWITGTSENAFLSGEETSGTIGRNGQERPNKTLQVNGHDQL